MSFLNRVKQEVDETLAELRLALEVGFYETGRILQREHRLSMRPIRIAQDQSRYPRRRR